MVLKKTFLYLILSFVLLHANLLEKVVYVESLDNKYQKSIKDEFFDDETKAYTITVAALTKSKYNPLEYFKTYKMKNALAYSYGKNQTYIRIISGVYSSYKEAEEGISKLDKRLLINKPYIISIKRHQNQFKKYNNIPFKNIAASTTSIKKVNSEKAIFSSNAKQSQELKKELLKNGSKLYAVAVASIPKNTVDEYLKNNNISDKAIAHTYGKSKKNVRVIYGLYSSYKQAQEDIKNLNEVLKSNKPYAMKMKYFQNYFKKHNPNYSEENIVDLKIKDKNEEETSPSPKLNPSIKVVEVKKLAPTKKFNPKPKEEKKKEIKKQKVKKVANKEIKKPKVKVLSREEKNKNRFLKESELEDIYYVEEDGDFNLLSEVFLNENSSFYTIDLGEINLNETTIEKFFIEKNLKNDVVAYKYGDKKEYARAIYGAYESKNAANTAIKNLKVDTSRLRVSNIKNHQKLYKMYHENILKAGPKKKSKKNIVNKSIQKIKKSKDDIVYVEKSNKNRLKDEFYKSNSPFYTITLITFHKNDLSVEQFFKENNIDDDALAFSLGTKNDYYRVIYGIYSSSAEALKVIEGLGYELLKNKPYVSKVKTSKRRFESYNNRDINNYKAIKLELE